MSNKPTERKDLQHEIANEGMYLIVGKDGLELWRVEEDGTNVFTGMVFPNVEAAHSYVFPEGWFLGLSLKPPKNTPAANGWNFSSKSTAKFL